MAYEPVVSKTSGRLRATALCGTHAVLIGFNLTGGAPARKGLLGFAIHREDLTENEAYWLRGQIRFKGDPGDHGADVPTNRAPLQKFHWADYTAKPGHKYRYAVHPVYGPWDDLDVQAPVRLEVTAAGNRASETGVHFNRGVTAAIAYRRRFGDVAPDDVPDGAAYTWLSRGLEEALLAFIGGAGAGDELKVSIYEYEHASIVGALRAAKGRGVTVRLVYHAKPGDKQTAQNRTHVNETGLARSRIVARTAVPGIHHNKFIVRWRNGAPKDVWTGSTNFTDAGLYLQTNVGVVLRERPVVGAFDDYFETLWRDLGTSPMKDAVAAVVAHHAGGLPGGCRLFFSPVRGADLLDTAVTMIDKARECVFISMPFGLDGEVVKALNRNSPRVVEYGLVNTTSRKKTIGVIDRGANSWIAAPTWIKEYDGRLWDARAYGNHKIHVKSIVTDPWGDTPRVLIGSANFSDESVSRNDENAIYLEGDRRVAAIVATEFLRMFDHYKFRDYLERAKKKTSERYLVEDERWTDPYFDRKKSKYRERQVFAG